MLLARDWGEVGQATKAEQTKASDGHGGGQAVSSRPQTDLRHQSLNPVLIQLDFAELEDQAQAG